MKVKLAIIILAVCAINATAGSCRYTAEYYEINADEYEGEKITLRVTDVSAYSRSGNYVIFMAWTWQKDCAELSYMLVAVHKSRAKKFASWYKSKARYDRGGNPDTRKLSGRLAIKDDSLYLVY